MGPQHLSFGGGVADTIVNPAVLVAVLMAGIAMWLLPRPKAIIPFLAAGILIPMDQIIVVGGLHFPMLRVLVLFGFMRMIGAKLSGGEKVLSGGMNAIDKALIALMVFTAVDSVLLWRAWGEVVFQFGILYTAFGVYFLLRYLIRDEEDVRRALRVLAWVTVVIAGFMVYEYFTRRNLIYAILGGSRAFLQNASVRGNDVRATGPFGHPILAGTFGGFMAPLFVGWWKKEQRDRIFAGLGGVASAVIPFSVGSSTALFALLAGVSALCMWSLRNHVRMICWGVVGMIVSLDMVMKSPVWHLIARVHLADGSSSYHRYELVNQCILHFWDWALIGTKNFGSWGWGMGDLANQYVGTADTAGLIPLIAFISLLVFGFKYVGKARQHYETDRQQEFFLWAIGSSLFANAVAFLGISYWDQIIVPWYALLAIICTFTQPIPAGVASSSPKYPTITTAALPSSYQFRIFGALSPNARVNSRRSWTELTSRHPNAFRISEEPDKR